MENKDKQLKSEKVSYNYYPEESEKEQDLDQSEHIKKAKERQHENDTINEKESYNSLPGHIAEQ